MKILLKKRFDFIIWSATVQDINLKHFYYLAIIL